MQKVYRVVVTQSAKNALQDIIDYINKDSPSAALKVRNELIHLISSLNHVPERFSKEIYLANRDGNYRSVTKWSYKIVYRILEEDVVVLSIFHTGQHPEKLKSL
ncbi:MAG TPA: type II toxin-antitoxin system RelE/ParE family toxin [Cyclobacteriaceae bacterium]|nr:type II toxin-antitoxin system RelE/ParE family toxin [Cyclobacteriaceae bacterium]